MENILWKKVWTLPNKYLLVNKVKEIYFLASLFVSTIQRAFSALASSCSLTFIVSKFNLSIDVNCTFCDWQPETVLYFSWHYVHTRKLWQDICQFIVHFIHNDFELFFKDILFGVFTFEKQYGNIYFLCNLIRCLAQGNLSRGVVLRAKVHSLPHLQLLPDSNSQHLDYESDSLTIRPQLPLLCIVGFCLVFYGSTCQIFRCA